MVEIDEVLLNQIKDHAQESYPDECFGFLIGEREPARRVYSLVRGKNIAVRCANRYEMDVDEFARIDKLAESRGLEVIGFYHSHPDGVAVPSASDLAAFWSGTVYLIVSVVNGTATACSAWELGAAEGAAPVPQNVVITCSSS